MRLCNSLINKLNCKLSPKKQRSKLRGNLHIKSNEWHWYINHRHPIRRMSIAKFITTAALGILDNRILSLLVATLALLDLSDILVHIVNVDVRNLCLVSVEDLCEFFESGTSGLHVEEVDKDEFDEDPDL